MSPTSLAARLTDSRSGYWGAEPGRGETDVRVVRNGDVDPDAAGVDWERCPVRGVRLVERDRALIRRGDVLITTSGDCGKVALVRHQPPVDTIASNFVRILRGDSTVDARFLFRWLTSAPARGVMTAHVRGTTLKNLSFAAFAETVRFEVPGLAAQRRIADILDKADAIRRKRKEAIALTEELLRSAFLEMFGDPVTNPKGWAVKPLGELGELERGRSRHRPRNDPRLLGGVHPLIQTGEVANCDGIIRSYEQTYSDLGLSQSKLWPAGTLCITIAANIAKTGVLAFDACFPDSVVGFTPGGHATTEFVQYWLRFLQPVLERQAPQSAQKNINLEILRTLDVPTPDVDLQRLFSKVVRKVRVARDGMRQTNGTGDELFHSLVARAFSGALWS